MVNVNDYDFESMDMDEDSESIFKSLAFSEVLRGSGYESVLALSPETMREVNTPRRLEIIEAVVNNPPFDSQTALAEHLDRDRSIVHRDLEILYDAMVLEQDHLDNRSSRPVLAHETVVCAPIVANGEMIDTVINLAVDGAQSDVETEGPDE